MTNVEFLAKLDKAFRKHLKLLPNHFYVSFYSNQKKKFLKKFAEDYQNFQTIQFDYKAVKLWDINFNSPIFNAAGMFKHSEAYYTVAMQGAGAWLTGTFTTQKRIGNIKNGILHPVLPLPVSGNAINWMGLPNEGIEFAAKKISEIQKFNDTPIGVSISADPGMSNKEVLPKLIEGMHLLEKANVDFIELNESCPNVSSQHSLVLDRLDPELVERMEYISKNFLKNRKRNLPLILKLSNDTDINLIPHFIDLSIDLEFDGINLGNTSTNYTFLKSNLNDDERKLFNYFTNTFGGGVSGRNLKENSKKLCKLASEHIQKKNLSREFNIIRTGGVENLSDILESKEIGVSLNQWYTGYFDNFGINGHNIYKNLFSNNL